MKIVSPRLFKQDTPVDEFVHETGKDVDGRDCTFVRNDVIVLFNQERLEHFGSDTIQSIIDSFAPCSSPLAELRSKLNDDQLCSLVKSRHIQSKGDLLRYIEQIGSDKSLLEQEILAAQYDSSVDSSDDSSGDSDSADS